MNPLNGVALGLKDLSQNLNGFVSSIKGLVAQASHAERKIRLVCPSPHDTLLHELGDIFAVLLPAPWPGLGGIPLVACSLHRLVMARRHHYAVVVRQLLVLRVVRKEDISRSRREGRPHRGPEHVRLETEEEVEDVFVEFRVELSIGSAVELPPPAIERGRFVIDEQAAESDTGFAMGGGLGKRVNVVVFLRRDICPVVVSARQER